MDVKLFRVSPTLLVSTSFHEMLLCYAIKIAALLGVLGVSLASPMCPVDRVSAAPCATSHMVLLPADCLPLAAELLSFQRPRSGTHCPTASSLHALSFTNFGVISEYFCSIVPSLISRAPYSGARNELDYWGRLVYIRGAVTSLLWA